MTGQAGDEEDECVAKVDTCCIPLLYICIIVALYLLSVNISNELMFTIN